MKLEEGKTYTINLATLADRLGGIGAGSCRVKVVEYGLRGYDGRLTGDKTLHLVSDDERERFICCDGEEVDFNGVDQWDCAQLATASDRSDVREFELDVLDAEAVLEEC